MNSTTAGCTVAAGTRLTTVSCAAPCTSLALPVTVTSLSTDSNLSTNSVQAVVSTKRKRKFPGPAGVLPKLVRKSMINVSYSLKGTGPL